MSQNAKKKNHSDGRNDCWPRRSHGITDSPDFPFLAPQYIIHIIRVHICIEYCFCVFLASWFAHTICMIVYLSPLHYVRNRTHIVSLQSFVVLLFACDYAALQLLRGTETIGFGVDSGICYCIIRWLLRWLVVPPLLPLCFKRSNACWCWIKTITSLRGPRLETIFYGLRRKHKQERWPHINAKRHRADSGGGGEGEGRGLRKSDAGNRNVCGWFAANVLGPLGHCAVQCVCACMCLFSCRQNWLSILRGNKNRMRKAITAICTHVY